MAVGRKKEMFYLTAHSTHFIYGYILSPSSTACKKPVNLPRLK